MPIGNLTSQLFANIYLNELDRFVRHRVRPLGYVRYGDDVVLFATSRTHAVEMGRQCQEFLGRVLFLQTHPSSGVVKVSSGLHFLGHYIYPEGRVVAPRLQRKLRREAATGVAQGHQVQLLPRRLRRDLAWIMLEAC